VTTLFRHLDEAVEGSSMNSRMNAIWNAAGVTLMACIGSGCGDSSSSSSAPPKPAAEAKVAAVAEPTVPADESLTSEEYMRLGLPAHDREWVAEDMAKAEKVLTALAQTGYRQLPRYRSERSGEVFARLVSTQNHDAFKNQSLPFEIRFPLALNYFQASNQVFARYVAGFIGKEVPGSDVVELMGNQLRTTAILLDLADEFVPRIKKDDPQYQVRMEGLDQMRRGLASIISGGLQTLTEKESYRSSDLVRLVGYMLDTYAQIVPRLPPGARTETLLRLEAMQADPALQHLQPGLRELYVKVKGSLEKPAAP